MLQKDPILLNIQKDLQLLIYRYLCFQSEEARSNMKSSEELDVSLMNLSQVSVIFLIKWLLDKFIDV